MTSLSSSLLTSEHHLTGRVEVITRTFNLDSYLLEVSDL